MQPGMVCVPAVCNDCIDCVGVSACGSIGWTASCSVLPVCRPECMDSYRSERSIYPYVRADSDSQPGQAKNGIFFGCASLSAQQRLMGVRRK